MQYYVLAFYQFCEIPEPEQLVSKWQRHLDQIDVRSRIYISHDGVNGQMSIAKSEYKSFDSWIREDERFASMDIKIHEDVEHVFPSCHVRYREQLAALDEKIDRSLNGEYLTPQEWKEQLASRDENTLVLDVRNDYEWDLGHFDGAERPPCKTFREFPAYAQSLKEKYDPEKTTVLMSCTGGIRCEVFSPYMKQLGFKNVYQLKGGVIKYGLEVGHEYWRGKLFVFDDRLAVPISPDNEEIISSCTHCCVTSDQFYNCANMDCNELFICCPVCAEKMHGCCSDTCKGAPRVRPFGGNAGRIKPYRRLSYEEKQRLR